MPNNSKEGENASTIFGKISFTPIGEVAYLGLPANVVG